MIDAVIGNINSEIVLSFDLNVGKFDDPNDGDPSNLDHSKKKCIIKGSKALEKGAFVPFFEGENEKNTEYYVLFNDLISDIGVLLRPSAVSPKTKIYVKLPTPDRYEVSELYVTGHFDITRINVSSSKKTINGAEFQQKLEKEKKLSIDHKVFFDIVGPPLVKQEVLSSDFGEIKRIKVKTDVEI